MKEYGLVGFVLLAVNLLMTYLGLKKMNFFNKFCFRVEDIVKGKDYKRLITSAFLHVSWMHFIVNMITLICFSSLLEVQLGEVKFILIYFSSLIAASLFTLYMQRNYMFYNAVGASGAVMGLVFASIAIFPDLRIGLYGILFISSWLYGFAYVLYTIYGIIKQRDYIGHEAHLGGGLAGLTLAILFEPSSLFVNYLPILLIVIPSVVFIFRNLWKSKVSMFKLFLENTIIRNKNNKSIHLNKNPKEQKKPFKTGDTRSNEPDFGEGQGKASGGPKDDLPIRPR